jgi:RNA polymerase sigma factor (sigma-70 family)
MIYGMVGNENDAWDLAQQAFVKAWRSIHKFEGRSSFYTWLYRLTVNLAIDSLRRKERCVEVEPRRCKGRNAGIALASPPKASQGGIVDSPSLCLSMVGPREIGSRYARRGNLKSLPRDTQGSATMVARVAPGTGMRMTALQNQNNVQLDITFKSCNTLPARATQPRTAKQNPQQVISEKLPPPEGNNENPLTTCSSRVGYRLCLADLRPTERNGRSQNRPANSGIGREV